MSAKPVGESDDEKRAKERRRLIDLTRREKGLPERRNLGTDRRASSPRKRPAKAPGAGAGGSGDSVSSDADGGGADAGAATDER